MDFLRGSWLFRDVVIKTIRLRNIVMAGFDIVVIKNV